MDPLLDRDDGSLSGAEKYLARQDYPLVAAGDFHFGVAKRKEAHASRIFGLANFRAPIRSTKGQQRLEIVDSTAVVVKRDLRTVLAVRYLFDENLDSACSRSACVL